MLLRALTLHLTICPGAIFPLVYWKNKRLRVNVYNKLCQTDT